MLTVLTLSNVLYNQSTERKLSFLEFRLAVVRKLLELEPDEYLISIQVIYDLQVVIFLFKSGMRIHLKFFSVSVNSAR